MRWSSICRSLSSRRAGKPFAGCSHLSLSISNVNAFKFAGLGWTVVLNIDLKASNKDCKLVRRLSDPSMLTSLCSLSFVILSSNSEGIYSSLLSGTSDMFSRSYAAFCEKFVLCCCIEFRNDFLFLYFVRCLSSSICCLNFLCWISLSVV